MDDFRVLLDVLVFLELVFGLGQGLKHAVSYRVKVRSLAENSLATAVVALTANRLHSICLF